ncbi:MAG: heat-inducible transcriptional repressor HrcA [Gammaproteobacteria bacterium]
MVASVKEGILSARAQHLFRLLVERYISDGQPVGSRTLARDAGMDLSPATIRNVMADLEDLGLIRSPHTSAGRVPTTRGYRFFVDSLLTVKAVSQQEVMRLHADLGIEDDINRLLAKTSNLLSEVTRLAGVVMVPRAEHRALRHVEFVRMSDTRVLVILVINNNEVHNRVICTARTYSESELQQASNYLNHVLVGRELFEVRDQLVAEMSSVQQEMNRMMQAAVEMAQKVFETPHDDYVWAGQTNLMGIEAWADIAKLRQLFEAFSQKREILHLLDQALNAQGVQIFIGDESGYEFLDDCSLVTSTYSADGRVLGVLGIIGPTRMAYERVIPIVDVTAKVLGLALKSLN